MKLKSLRISNFKSIGSEGLTINFSPITLLFGPNNVGKSTIVQALCLAYEFFCKDIPDYDNIEDISLGRFNDYVHDHNLALPVTLCITVEINKDEFDQYLSLNMYPYSSLENYETDIKDRIKAKDVYDIGVEFSLIWSIKENHSVVDSFTVSLGDERFFMVKKCPYTEEIPFVGFVSAFTELAEKFVSDFRAATQGMVPNNIPGSKEFKDSQFWFPLGKWGTPDWESDLQTYVLTDGPEINGLETSTLFSMSNKNLNISNTFLKPCHAIRDLLKSFIAIGPLREIPGKSETGERSWWNGLAAWDLLKNISQDKLDLINAYLAKREYFDTGYRIIQAKTHELEKDGPIEQMLHSLLDSFGPYFQELVEGDDAHVDKEKFQNIFKACMPKILSRLPLIEMLLCQPYKVRILLENGKHEVSPYEMGTGISQIVPVLVAACADKEESIVAIEQPELHVHPAWQTALADVFIRAIKQGAASRMFLIETHSEHLMLRLLRRLRETTDNELPENFPPVITEDIGVYYIYQNAEGILEAVEIPLREDGDFEVSWPNGFFRERMRELF